jgi:hypothetical protein
MRWIYPKFQIQPTLFHAEDSRLAADDVCHLHIFKNSASLMIFTPSFCALSSFEPAFLYCTAVFFVMMTFPPSGTTSNMTYFFEATSTI